MPTNIHQGSAKIYQFPVGGRRAAGEQGEKAKAAANRMPQRAPEAGFGEAWYHEAAIREGELPRKS